MNHSNYLHSELTGQIIKAFFQVYNSLGYGFTEHVYENSLKIELENMGLQCLQQQPLRVYYRDRLVGEFYADLIVNNSVIIELKATNSIAPKHEAQLLTYLKATDIEVGLVLNFGPEPQQIRKVLTNDRKKLR